MATSPATEPAKNEPAPKPKRVNLRYLGTSHRLVDDTSQLVFYANGKPRDVSEEDAVRLETFNPFYDRFERVS